jgi:hypothetical protein
LVADGVTDAVSKPVPAQDPAVTPSPVAS